MKIRRHIQVKAAFLMLVFSLHTAVGFACAIDNKDIAYKHHGQVKSEDVTIHIHPDGKKHVHKARKESHENEKASLVPIIQPAAKGVHHYESDSDQKATHGGGNCCSDGQNKSDNCCTEKVIKFNQLDKSASNSLNMGISPVFFNTFLASFYYVDDLYISYINTGKEYFVRSHHPPIPDIRIKIQSFQI